MTRQQGRAAGRQCDRPFPLSADPEGRQGLGSSQQAAEGDPDAMLDNNLGAHFAQPLIYIEVLKRYNLFSDPAAYNCRPADMNAHHSEQRLIYYSLRKNAPGKSRARSVLYNYTSEKQTADTGSGAAAAFAFSRSDPAPVKSMQQGQSNSGREPATLRQCANMAPCGGFSLSAYKTDARADPDEIRRQFGPQKGKIV